MRKPKTASTAAMARMRHDQAPAMRTPRHRDVACDLRLARASGLGGFGTLRLALPNATGSV